MFQTRPRARDVQSQGGLILDGGLVVIAIDGRSGSGKTQLAKSVIQLDPDISIIEIENFYQGWHGLATGPLRLAREVLRPWAAGLPGRARFWDWHAMEWEQRLREMPKPSSQKVLIEGCGAGAKTLDPFLSGLVWVEAPERVRYERAMARDGEVFAPHWREWADQEDELFATNNTAARADLIVT